MRQSLIIGILFAVIMRDMAEEVKMLKCCREAVNKGLLVCPKCHQIFMNLGVPNEKVCH